MNLSDSEITIIKHILKKLKINYYRGYRCKICNTLSKSFYRRISDERNVLKDMICEGCGSISEWEDIKIKKITGKIKKIDIEIIEDCKE